MKIIKIYLVVATCFLVIALGLGVYIWYMVQKLNTAVVESTLETGEGIGDTVIPTATST